MSKLSCHLSKIDHAPIQAVIDTIPGDKSISHRAVILGSLAEGVSEFNNFLCADDCLNTAQIFKEIGVKVNVDKIKKTLKIHGQGKKSLKQPSGPLNVGNSGTGIRLITGVLAGQPFNTSITGDASIQKRPMKRITEPLSQMKAHITGVEKNEQLYPPLSIESRPLSGICYPMPVASAQVKSSLLLAGLFTEDPVEIIEKSPTRNHTECIFKNYQIDLEDSNGHIRLGNNRNPIAPSAVQHIPADFSSAAFLIALALLHPNADITLKKIGLNPTRAALLDHLKKMGASIEVHIDPEAKNEVYGDIKVKSSTLKNAPVDPEIIPFIIDEFPILSVIAMMSDGDWQVAGVEELRVKESDRIAGIVSLLSKLGCHIKESKDGFSVLSGPKAEKPDTIHFDACHDHRLAMSAIIASIVTQTPFQITGCEYVTTSFPNFFEIIESLGIPLTLKKS